MDLHAHSVEGRGADKRLSVVHRSLERGAVVGNAVTDGTEVVNVDGAAQHRLHIGGVSTGATGQVLHLRRVDAGDDDLAEPLASSRGAVDQRTRTILHEDRVVAVDVQTPRGAVVRRVAVDRADGLRGGDGECRIPEDADGVGLRGQVGRTDPDVPVA